MKRRSVNDSSAYSTFNSTSLLFEERERKLNELFGKAQLGDSQSYRSLLGEISELLKKYFKNALNKVSGAASEQVPDLVQETLLAIHEKRGTFDPKERFGPWMYAIARYKLIDYYRKHSKEKVAQDWDLLEASLSCESLAVELETHEDLEGLLGAIPEKQSKLVRMLKIQGRSVQDVSKELGMTESALKVSVHRAIKALQEQLKKDLNSELKSK